MKILETNLDLSEAVEAMDSVMYVKYGDRQHAVLEFMVCEDGTICDVSIKNKDKVSPEVAKAVLNLMKRTPKWTPALSNGKAVRTLFKQPISVVLSY